MDRRFPLTPRLSEAASLAIRSFSNRRGIRIRPGFPKRKRQTPPAAKPKCVDGIGLPCDALPLYEEMRQTALLVLQKRPKSPIFHVDFGGGSEVVSKEFIARLPAGCRSVFDCQAFKRFLDHWGDLVTVNPYNGSLTPLFWNASRPGVSEGLVIPPCYRDAVGAVAMLFSEKKVSHEFKVTEETKSIGHAEAGGYMHMRFEFPSEKVNPMPGFPPDTPTLVYMLSRVLEKNDLYTVVKAAHLLMNDKLSYASEHKGAIQYLRDLMQSGVLTRKTMDDIAYHNLLHHHAADAPPGCLQALRSGAVSDLLFWIGIGKGWRDIDDVHNIHDTWDQVAGPIPCATPSAGNIAAAEKLFADLGITKVDLEREYLTADRIPENGFVWRSPAPKTAESSGLFSRIVPKLSARTDTAKDLKSDDPPTPISFVKFATVVLPGAEKVEYLLSDLECPFFFVTGRPGTRPLMEWHNETNLASWYQYPCVQRMDSECALKPGWSPVSQIISFPHMWNDHPASYFYSYRGSVGEPFKYGSYDISYLFCLDGIHDKNLYKAPMLDPEYLKREFHGVGSTIAAFSEANSVADCAAPIGGMWITNGDREIYHEVRVTSATGRVDTYRILLFD